MIPASRFALPAALSLSLSSLAGSMVQADGPSSAPRPQAFAAADSSGSVAAGPRLRPFMDLIPLSFGERFTQRLQHEAKGHMDLAAVPPASAVPGSETLATFADDGGNDRRVKRLLTRALRGVLDEELATVAQGAPFATFLRRGAGRDGPGGEGMQASPRADPAPGGVQGAGSNASGDRRFDATFGVRLDAHPRLQLRTRFGSFSGVVEVPVLDPELRIGLERPLGPTGRAALRAGTGGDRGDWASLNFAFGF